MTFSPQSIVPPVLDQLSAALMPTIVRTEDHSWPTRACWRECTPDFADDPRLRRLPLSLRLHAAQGLALVLVSQGQGQSWLTRVGLLDDRRADAVAETMEGFVEAIVDAIAASATGPATIPPHTSTPSPALKATIATIEGSSLLGPLTRLAIPTGLRRETDDLVAYDLCRQLPARCDRHEAARAVVPEALQPHTARVLMLMALPAALVLRWLVRAGLIDDARALQLAHANESALATLLDAIGATMQARIDAVSMELAAIARELVEDHGLPDVGEEIGGFLNTLPAGSAAWPAGVI